MVKSNCLTTLSNSSVSFEQYLSAKRTHQYMLNTFISLLILGFIHLPLNTYSLVISDSSWNIAYYRRIYMIIANVILIGLYGFGLLVLDRHSRIGLIAFAWLVAILDVIATVAVLFIFFVTIFLPSTTLSVSEIFISAFLFAMLSIAGIIVITISIKHAFNLSKLIKNNKQLMIEQV